MASTSHPEAIHPPSSRARGVGMLSTIAPLVIVVGAIGLGLSGGWFAVRFADAFHFRPSPVHVVALLGAVGVAAAVLHRPVVGLVALILLVYLNLSDVLIRFHDLPSLLQLLMIPLFLAALVEWRADVLEGLTPGVVTVAIIAYVLTLLLSSTVAEDPGLSDAKTIEATKGFILYVLVLLLVTTPERARAGAWALVAGAALLSAIGLTQVATGTFDSDYGGLARMEWARVYEDVRDARLAGPVGDPNFFAQILLIVFPFAFLLGLRERSIGLRFLALGAAAAVTATVVLTYSRGGAVALGIVAVCCLFAARPSRARLLFGGALLVTGLALLPATDFGRRLETLEQLGPGQEDPVEMDTSLRVRILYARVAWRMFLDHPVLGAGAGNYTVHYYDYANEVGSSSPEYDKAGGDHYPHNLYLEVASETGLVGLITFGTVILLLFGNLYRAGAAHFREGDHLTAALASALLIAILGYLVSSLFLHGHFQRHLWILLGLSAAIVRMAPTPRTPAWSVAR